ncbi:unnamed protein product, partial [Didymodactylos carnosus]
GSGGKCAKNYSRAAESILGAAAKLFAGKNYKHTVSDNCCIWTSAATENYGMSPNDCNSEGPFTVGPVKGADLCTNVVLHNPKQLTFCGSH